MAKKAKRQGLPTWSDYIRSRWGIAGGCPTAQAARQWVAEQEAAGHSVAQIWRSAVRTHPEWTNNVHPDDDVYPDDMTIELDNIFANNTGWSPAFTKAVKNERKRLEAIRKKQVRIDTGKVVPTLVRVGRRVDAKF